MGGHEKSLELCASATAGELTAEEQATLEEHLATCPECRQAMKEYELASRFALKALASDKTPEQQEAKGAWAVEEAEKAFLKRLNEESPKGFSDTGTSAKLGQRFGYRPSRVEWREVWMSLAAVVLLALALAVTAYRSGVKRGTDIAGTTKEPAKNFASLEEQASDVGHERAQLLAKLTEEDKAIADLKQRLLEQQRMVSALKASDSGSSHPPGGQQTAEAARYDKTHHDPQLAAAEGKLADLEKTVDTLAVQRDQVTSRAAALEAKVGELTQLVRDREREVDQQQAEVAKQRDLLDHDRDIRELMGARDLYIAEVHDVAGTGQTNKSYGRVFYTRGKRLIFYAYDLDAQPGIQNVTTFQAWGRRGPDKEQARNLGIFYEDNVNKKRWVLKAEDPKTLEDIDAVFVTVEPNGGSQHPSGKRLLFAYLQSNPNHP